MHVSDHKYEEVLVAKGAGLGSNSTLDLRVTDLQDIVKEFKKLAEPPKDPFEQLHAAIISMFRSWQSDQARNYRDLHHKSNDFGTGVIVQMVSFSMLLVNLILCIALLFNTDGIWQHELKKWNRNVLHS